MQRKTKQRSAVVAVLNESQEFQSAQQLHAELIKSGYSVGLATVYRNLELLAKNGEVEVIRSEEGESLYRRCDEEHHHHHLVCRECGRSEDLASEELEKWIEQVSAAHNFSNVTHSADLFGLCEVCTQK